jgi:hypothetical protein
MGACLVPLEWIGDHPRATYSGSSLSGRATRLLLLTRILQSLAGARTWTAEGPSARVLTTIGDPLLRELVDGRDAGRRAGSHHSGSSFVQAR